jgi:hypothetical protein
VLHISELRLARCGGLVDPAAASLGEASRHLVSDASGEAKICRNKEERTGRDRSFLRTLKELPTATIAAIIGAIVAGIVLPPALSGGSATPVASTTSHPSSHPQTLSLTQEVEQALNNHYVSIETKHYRDAWHDLVGYAREHSGGESAWVQRQQANPIDYFSLEVAATLDRGEAIAKIKYFKTYHGESCSELQGEWRLAKVSNKWRISDAHKIQSPTGCPK